MKKGGYFVAQLKDNSKGKTKKKEKKKPYQKPEIRSEKILETQALACEKCDIGGPTFTCIGIWTS